MADTFGLTDDMYLSANERGIAADLARAYASSDAVRERTLARYGIPQAASQARDGRLSEHEL